MCNELKKFMRKFTVITKDGSKWLRPVNPFDNNDPRFTSKEPFCILGMRPCGKAVCECDEWKRFEKNNPILPYIGSRPEGTVLSEEQVKPRRQVLYNEEWQQFKRPIPNGNYETRTAYTDAESHDRHASGDKTYNYTTSQFEKFRNMPEYFEEGAIVNVINNFTRKVTTYKVETKKVFTKTSKDWTD